jgi:hypothetical protein
MKMADKLDISKTYNLSAKGPDGKWQTLGRLQVNKFGNWSVSFKRSDQLVETITGQEWTNLAVFEQRQDRDTSKQAYAAKGGYVKPENRGTVSEHNRAKANGYAPDDDQQPW